MKSKQLIFLGLVLLSQINSFAGLAPNTLVYTPDGLVVLQDLIVSNLVVSQHDSSLITNSILQVKQAIHDQYLKISLTQGDLRVSLNQVFYVPKLNQWIPASSLVSGDYLLSMSGGLIKIQEIKLVQEPFKALNLTVANDHNFYISQDLILVHNEPVTFALVGGALVAQKALEFAVAYGAKAFLAG